MGELRLKDDLLAFFVSKILIRIQGNGVERLLNHALREGVRFSEMKRNKDGVQAIISVKSLAMLRSLRRRHGCIITIHKRLGVLFLLKRLSRYHGFTLGILLALAMIFVLSNITWGIKIEGASPKTEYQIIKKLESYGVSVGKPIFLLQDVDTIQKKLEHDINNITWIGVEKKGTVYYFQVVEKIKEKVEKKISPRHLVAKKEAVITKMYVEKGKPMVVINDHVKKGQIIVSGLIGREGEEKSVASKASVFGETWYVSTVEVPLNTKFSVLNGKFEKKYRMSLGQLSFPVWGFKKSEIKDAKVQEIDHPIYIFGKKLPISFQTKMRYEKEMVARDYTTEEAIEMGKEMAKKDVRKKIGKYGKIMGERMIDSIIEKDKIIITFHVQALEDIAKPMPITAYIIENKE